MMSWLIDTSAFVRLQLGQASDSGIWNARIERGLVRISTITRLEVGFSVRAGEAGRMIFAEPPLSLMPIEYLTPAMEDRAWGCRCCWQTVASIVRRPSQNFSSPQLPRSWA